MINAEQIKNELKVSYINSDGLVGFKTFKIPESEQFEWIHANKEYDPIVRSWDNKKVRKKATTILNSYRIAEFLMTMPQKDQDEIFANNTPKKYYCDIETEILDVFDFIQLGYARGRNAQYLLGFELDLMWERKLADLRQEFGITV